MAVKYQKVRFAIAGSLAAAVIGGTAYFAQPVSYTPAAADANPATTTAIVTSNSQTVSGQTAASPAQTTSRVTTTKAKKTRGS